LTELICVSVAGYKAHNTVENQLSVPLSSSLSHKFNRR
jgi:hypothetical protein